MSDRIVRVVLRGEVTQLKAAMAQSAASVKGAADSMTAATKQGAAFRSGLTTLGTTAGKVGLVAAAGLGAAILAAAKFDKAMSDVQAATHESAANMDLLRAAALKAGADTVFSASEAAGAIEALAKAGVSTQDILGGGLTGALDLAAAGGMEVADAAEAAATAMTQFGLAGSDVPHIADLLAAAAGKAQGEVSDFSAALNQSGLIADQVGLSIEETTGGLAAFASAGLLGSDAGTSFKTMLGSLTPNSTKAAELMDQLGISAYDAQGNFIGLADFAGNLRGALSDMSDEQRQAALETIFGSDAVRAASVLYEQGETGIRAWTNAVDDQGYAAETAATKLDNLAGDLEALKGSLETALIGAGAGSQSGLRELVQDLTDVVNLFNKLPPSAQGATTSLLGLTAILGGGAWFTAKSIVGVSEMRKALDDLGPAGTRAAGGLKAVSIIAAAGLGLDIAVDLLAQLNQEIDDTAPNVYVLRSNLKDLVRDGDVSSLVANMGDLQGAIAAASDPTLFKSITDFYDKIPVFGSVLPNLLEIAPVSGDQLRDLREAQASLTSLDEALSGLAASEGPRAARQAFKDLADTYHLTAEEQSRLISLLPTAAAFLDGIGDSAKSAAVGANFFGDTVGGLLSLFDPLGTGTAAGADGIKGVGDAAEDAEDKVNAFKVALEALNGLLDKRGAVRAYQDSIDALGKTVKEFGPNSREAAAGFDDIARNVGVVASSLKGAAKVDFLTKATSDLEAFGAKLKLPPRLMGPVIDSLYAAMAAADKATGAQADLIKQYHLTPKQVDTLIKQSNMGASQDDIRDLLHQYGLTPKQIQTAVKLLGAAAAESQINYLTRARTIDVYVNQRGGVTSSYGGSSANDTHAAAGGYIRGPGTSTSDSIPAWLSDREYVVKAAAVDHYGVDFMHSLNAMHFAVGGAASRRPMPVTGRGAAYLDLTAAELGVSTFAKSTANAADATDKATDAEGGHQAAEDRREKAKEARERTHDQRERDLERAIRQSEKAFDDHREATDEARDAFRQVRDDMRSFSESVSSNFALDYQFNPEAGTSAADQLRASLLGRTADANDFYIDLKAAAANGLSGGLFNYISELGDAGLADEFAQMNRREIRRYEHLFAESQRAGARPGEFAGQERYGHELREARREAEKQTRLLEEARDDLREAKQHLKDFNHDGPERTGKAVGDAMNDTAARAGRKRART